MNKPLVIKTLAMLLAFNFQALPQNHPAGARFTGMANSAVSISDVWSTFHNQATLTGIPAFSAGIFYESRFLIDEMSLSAISLIVPSGTGTFSASFYQFGEGHYKENKLGLAFSKKLSDRISAGIQFDYFQTRFPENEDNFGFPTFEIGITGRISRSIWLAAHLFNPVQNGYDFHNGKQKMHTALRIGGHYEFSDRVLLSLETEKRNEYKATVKTGIEFSPLKDFVLRFGVSGRPVQYYAGLGYQIKKITTDIGFSYHGNLGFSPSVSLQLNLL